MNHEVMDPRDALLFGVRDALMNALQTPDHLAPRVRTIVDMLAGYAPALVLDHRRTMAGVES